VSTVPDEHWPHWPHWPRWPQSDTTLYFIRIGVTIYPPDEPSGCYVWRIVEAEELGITDWDSTSAYHTTDRTTALKLAEALAMRKSCETWLVAEPFLGEAPECNVAHFDFRIQ